MTTKAITEFYSALPTKPRKAITALVCVLGGSIGTALLDGSLTQPEAAAALGAGLVSGFAVWRIPNPVNVKRLTRGPNPQLPPERFSGGPRG